MKKIYLLFGFIPMLLAYSCQNEPAFEEPQDQTEIPGDAINQTGGTEGMQYTLENLVVNPDLVVVNDSNSTLVGVEGDVVKVAMKEAFTFNVGDLVFFGYEGNQMLKVVEGVAQEGNVFTLTTVNGEFGNMFESGKMQIAVSLDKLIESEETRADGGKYCTILDLNGTYNLGDLTFNPNTYVGMYVYYTIEFKKWQLLPAQASLHFGMDVNITPQLIFEKAINKTIEFDLIDYVPGFLIDLLKKQEFGTSIEVPLIGELETKFSVGEISMPVTFEVNADKFSVFSFGYGGGIYAGIDIYRNGLKVERQPYFENTLSKFYPTLNLNSFAGEVNTNAEVVITPNFTVLNQEVGFVSGTLTFGLRTMSNYNELDIKEDGEPVADYLRYGTKGVFQTKLDVSVFNLINERVIDKEQVLWNIGEMNSAYFDNLQYTKAGGISSLLDFSRAPLDCTLAYWYDVPGKKIPEKLTIKFDWYYDFIATGIKGGSYMQEVTTTDNGDGTFSFTMDIPFFGFGAIASKKTEIDNIVIQDDYGYTGTLDGRYTIKR